MLRGKELSGVSAVPGTMSTTLCHEFLGIQFGWAGTKRRQARQKNEGRKMAKADRIIKWQEELDRLSVTWRWGETRRFQSNKRKIDRREWLINHITKETNYEKENRRNCG